MSAVAGVFPQFLLEHNVLQPTVVLAVAQPNTAPAAESAARIAFDCGPRAAIW